MWWGIGFSLLMFVSSVGLAHASVCGSVDQYASSDCYDWLKESCLSPYRVDRGVKGSHLSFSYEAYQNFPKEIQSPFAKSTLCRAPGIMGLEDLRADFEMLAEKVRDGALKEMTKEKAIQDTRVGLALVMLDLHSNVHESQKQDVDKISSSFENLEKKIGQPVKSISMAELDTLFGDKGFIATQMTRVQKGGTIQHSQFNQWVKNQFLEAYQSVEPEASKSSQENYMQEINKGPETLRDGIRDFLERFPSDEARYQFLVRQAKNQMVGGDVEGNLTPYHSKMILYYLYGQKVENHFNGKKESKGERDQILDSFANQLNLKMLNGSKNQGWRSTVPHNGYVLGAQGDMIDAIAHDDRSGKYGNGIDCTTAVQETLGVILGKPIPGRMTSAGLVGNQFSNYFEKNIVKTAKDAIPQVGDVITKRTRGSSVGHGEVMVGFRGDPPKALVVSAQGGYDRGVVLKEVDVYPGAPESCSESYYTENPDHSYYFMRLKTHASIFKF